MTTILPDPRQFADEDFRFRLGTHPGSAEEFFALSPGAAVELPERHWWLSSDRPRYAALLATGVRIAEEFLETVAAWPMLRGAPDALWSSRNSPLDRLVLLAQHLEPDFVLLAPGPAGQDVSMAEGAIGGPGRPPGGADSIRFTVAGGCVCFPSGWRLTDKLGQSVWDVHEPVPGLNEALGGPIDRLLAHLRPGKCVVRANWGVCRSPELNQHPDRNLPPVATPVRADEAWLRCEDQCLFTLPRTGGIVFGIRVTHTRWSDLDACPEAAASVARGLRTMPPDMRRYKRLEHVWEELAELLDGRRHQA